jgi:hypothetical protein
MNFGLGVCSFASDTRPLPGSVGAYPFFGFLQEESYSFLEVLKCLLLRSAAGGQVEFAGVSNESSTFLENLGGELDLHTLPGYSFGGNQDPTE